MRTFPRQTFFQSSDIKWGGSFQVVRTTCARNVSLFSWKSHRFCHPNQKILMFLVRSHGESHRSNFPLNFWRSDDLLKSFSQLKLQTFFIDSNPTLAKNFLHCTHYTNSFAMKKLCNTGRKWASCSWLIGMKRCGGEVKSFDFTPFQIRFG